MSRMRLEEVTDEYDLANPDDGYSDATGSDSDSDLGDEDGEDEDITSRGAGGGLPEESLRERLSALRDIIPPPARAKISRLANSTRSGISTAALLGGKSLWAITASLLMLGIPFMMAVEAEAQVQEEEKAMAMQVGGNDLLAPGSQSPVFAQPQQAPPQGVRPPGF